MNQEVFKKMKNTASFINTARGGLSTKETCRMHKKRGRT